MTTDTRSEADTSRIRKIAAAALTASTLEWYDFYVYGTAAALVFGPLFFSGLGDAAGTLAAFATFGVGFIFRPVGGLIFGHFGDRLGRKRLLVVAMLMMGVSTFLIGCLPGFATIGLAAPLLLVFLRAIQGIAVGGQYGGAMLLVTESAPPHKRGFYGSFAHIGPSLAVIVSNMVFLVVSSSMSPDAFASWGWRIPFLLSALVIAAGLFIQLRIEETDDFQRLQASEKAPTNARRARQRSPLLTALRTHPKQILQAGGMILLIQVYYYTLIVFTISYATAKGMSQSLILTLVLVSSAVTVISIPLFAALSDRAGRKKVIVPATVLSMASVVPFVLLLQTSQAIPTLLGLMIPGLALGAMYGPMAAFYSEMFSTGVRYSGASTGYQLGAVLGGGFAPLIATALFEGTGSLWAVAAYIGVAGILSLIAVLTATDNYRPTA